MGWTSYHYTESTHTTFNEENAKDFVQDQFVSSKHKVLAMYLHKAKAETDHNEIYLAMQNINGDKFLMVVLVDIFDQEILFKEIDESMGPSYANCPVTLLNFSPKPYNDYSKNWRTDIVRKKIKKKLNSVEFTSYF